MPRASFWWVFSFWSCLWEPTGRFLLNSHQSCPHVLPGVYGPKRISSDKNNDHGICLGNCKMSRQCWKILSRFTLRKSDKLDRNHAECSNPEVVEEYFDLLDKVLTDSNLKNVPRQIYNCDETFLPHNATREKVVTLKSTKNVYAKSHGTTEHISMLCIASGGGFPLPPMIIYPKA